jgi:alkylation response protein AidB-like acyl-CoA dehydrogenase
MQSCGAISAIETYPLNFTFDKMDVDYPLESLAMKHFGCLYSYSRRERGDLSVRRMKEYKIDGLVVWSDICCKYYALFANYLKTRAEKDLGIPGLVLDFIEDYPVQRYWRDARLFYFGYGTEEIQKLVIGRTIGL